MRKIILNLHLYGALVAGLFLIVLGVTGGIMAFEDDVDRLLDSKLFNIEPGTSPLPVATVLQSLYTACPGQRISFLRFPATPGCSYVATSGSKQIFVNGYTGAIVGERTLPTLMGRIHQLHTHLLAGKIGQQIVAYATVLSIFLVLSGVYLWWPFRRTAMKFGASRRGFSFDLHNIAGIYFALFLLVLSLTGVVMGFEEFVSPWIFKLTHSAPPGRDFPSVVQPNAKPLDADEAIRIAKAALPGAGVSNMITPRGPQNSFMLYMRFPEDFTPGGRSWVSVDQYSGKVLFVENSRTPPAGTAIVILNRSLHTGDIWGYPTKILMSLSSFMLAIQTVTGYCIWWKKLRRKPLASA